MTLTCERKLAASLKLTYQRHASNLGVTAELDDREIDNIAIFGSQVSILLGGISHNHGDIKPAKWSSDRGQYWFVSEKPYRERLVEV